MAQGQGQEDAGNGHVGWAVLVLAGSSGSAVGLIGGVPGLTLVAGFLTIIGVIGLTAARRKQRS
ncbi:hypothetical protein ACIO1C_15035 [Streptomyces sp. NPDC087420]|uniref:hypothetical protein n=1 Tax=Streptomyces sp. NPDC087420 TaxID=3365785 RepID=UPI00383621AB